MRKLLLFLFLLAGSTVVAQPLDSAALDTVRTYTSLESALRNPDKVYKLKLQKQGLSEIPKEVFLLKNLQVLDMSKNKIKVIPAEIGQLKNLEVLNLSKNRIHDIPSSIGQLVYMRSLILNQNEIETIPPEIGKLTRLIYLDMWSNNLWNFPEELRELSSLQEFDLRNIQLNFKEQDYISSLLPKTKIHFSPACNCGK